MRRLLRRGAGFALAAAVVLLPSAVVAAAGNAPSATGWWTDQPGASAEPDGGFRVSSFGGQPVAVAALRFSVPDEVLTATLTLQEADGSVVTPTTSLQACPTSSDWAGANPGPSSDAPEPDCTSPVVLSRDSDSLRWTGEVSALLSTGGGQASLMIVPADAPEGGSPIDPGFRVSFTAASLTISTPPETTPTTAFSDAREPVDRTRARHRPARPARHRAAAPRAVRFLS